MIRPTLRRRLVLSAGLTLGAACGDGGEDAIVTDVAVHTAPIASATLHRRITAYGYVEPAPAASGSPGTSKFQRAHGGSI